MFEQLIEAAERGELILTDNAMCNWHLRRDGQLTIREILVMPGYQGEGRGTQILEQLRATPGATSIFAKCPADLRANDWYASKGFNLEGEEVTKSGRKLKLWRLPL